MILHIVVMQFGERADAEAAVAHFADLAKEIPEIRELRIGMSSTRAPDSFDLGMTVGFDDIEQLKTYIHHPAHEAAAQFTRERRIGVAAADIEVPV